MHPPWIIFNYLLILFSITSRIRGDAEKNELKNSTITRPQRETYDRERRLIPYMTYYVTHNLMSPNTGTRQNIFVPIASPRENIFHLDTVTKLPLNNFQNVNPQQIEILPKPVVRLPSLLTPTIQVEQYKSKEESRIFPQIYRLESGLIRPQIQPQKIQSETQPLHVIKVSPSPTEQKYTPQLIKIIPLVTNVQLDDRSPKSFILPQPQSVYSRTRAYPITPGPHFANNQKYYKEQFPLKNENSFQENKLYPAHLSPGNLQVRLIESTPRPGANEYTAANIAIRTTTPPPPPYTDIKFNVNDGNGKSYKAGSNTDQVSISYLSQINPVPTEYSREPVISTVHDFNDEKYLTVTPRHHQTNYHQKATDAQREELQDSVEFQKTDNLPRLRVPEEEKIRFVASVTPVPVINDLESKDWKTVDEGQKKNIYDNQPLYNILSLLKETNKIPQNLTPDNIDTGIKTLALILERLKKQRNHGQRIPASDSSTVESSTPIVKQNSQNSKKVHIFPEKSGTSTPGKPGIDYPIYSSIPQTKFDCSTQRYKGFFGDPDTNCQVWHYCDLNGGQASFLCPNGTIFSQVALTCDWWFNVKCASTSQLYVLNERLYKYILPFSPSFPEDYSGPVVDKYLAAKFREMEAKSKIKASKSHINSTATAEPEITTESSTEAQTEINEDYKAPSGEE